MLHPKFTPQSSLVQFKGEQAYDSGPGSEAAKSDKPVTTDRFPGSTREPISLFHMTSSEGEISRIEVASSAHVVAHRKCISVAITATTAKVEAHCPVIPARTHAGTWDDRYRS
jgi:hypothetical protein